MTHGTEPSPEDSRRTPSITFQQWWSSNIAWFLPALSVLIAAIVLGIQIGGIKIRLENLEKNLDRSSNTVTDLRHSLENVRTSLEGRIDGIRSSIEGKEGLIVHIVEMESSIKRSAQDLENIKRLILEIFPDSIVRAFEVSFHPILERLEKLESMQREQKLPEKK